MYVYIALFIIQDVMELQSTSSIIIEDLLGI